MNNGDVSGRRTGKKKTYHKTNDTGYPCFDIRFIFPRTIKWIQNTGVFCKHMYNIISAHDYSNTSVVMLKRTWRSKNYCEGERRTIWCTRCAITIFQRLKMRSRLTMEGSKKVIELNEYLVLYCIISNLFSTKRVCIISRA